MERTEPQVGPRALLVIGTLEGLVVLVEYFMILFVGSGLTNTLQIAWGGSRGQSVTSYATLLPCLAALFWICWRKGFSLTPGKVSRSCIMLVGGTAIQFMCVCLYQHLTEDWIISWENYYKGDPSSISLVSLIMMLVVSPLSEEILFRGIIFDTIRARTGHAGTATLLASSGLFAMSHSLNFALAAGSSSISPYYVLVQIFVAFVAGVVLQQRAVSTGGLTDSLVLHMANNLSASFYPMSKPTHHALLLSTALSL
eukprot:TRINITY_DN12537_c0_g1_i1.p1 TRINITY_DN12537_c0_g1~~TRINITY_DN12537_c0_g1_i1.p1  ORF type:complete len:255 (+),score=47.97 TRINITY_DN12537_c0_g1_i1:446-1210(+)